MQWGSVVVEPEVERWLLGLSDHDFDQAAFYADLLAPRGVHLSEPYSRQLRGRLREVRFYAGRAQVQDRREGLGLRVRPSVASAGAYATPRNGLTRWGGTVTPRNQLLPEFGARSLLSCPGQCRGSKASHQVDDLQVAPAVSEVSRR